MTSDLFFFGRPVGLCLWVKYSTRYLAVQEIKILKNFSKARQFPNHNAHDWDASFGERKLPCIQTCPLTVGVFITVGFPHAIGMVLQRTVRGNLIDWTSHWLQRAFNSLLPKHWLWKQPQIFINECWNFNTHSFKVEGESRRGGWILRYSSIFEMIKELKTFLPEGVKLSKK